MKHTPDNSMFTFHSLAHHSRLPPSLIMCNREEMLRRYGVSENFAGSEVHVAVISLEDSPALLWWGKKSLVNFQTFVLLYFFLSWILASGDSGENNSTA